MGRFESSFCWSAGGGSRFSIGSDNPMEDTNLKYVHLSAKVKELGPIEGGGIAYHNPMVRISFQPYLLRLDSYIF